MEKNTPTVNRLGRSIWLALWLPCLTAGLFIPFLIFFLAIMSEQGAESPLFIVFVVWHAIYICAVAASIHTDGLKPLLRKWKIWCGAGAGLAVFGLFFVIFDMSASNYSCGDGAVIDRSLIPLWPWIWIGWLIAATATLPARVISAIEGRALELKPIWKRGVLIGLFSIPVLVTGVVFQVRTIDCTKPFVNHGWGAFEGGLILLPMLGLFSFTLCATLGILSAYSVKQA